jgi:chromatin remodeling complex protein RSC6
MTTDEDTGEIIELINSLRKQVYMIQNKVKILECSYKKHIKQTKKDNNKIKVTRKPSGFAKPTKVTDRLILFMQKDAGSLIARTEVTQYLIRYIKENSLQNKENRRVIFPDKKLLELLESGKEEVTYFNLQKYMNKHFIKEN